MIVLGVDIGTSGAIAAVDSRGTAVVHDLPVVDVGGAGRTRNRLDGRALIWLVRELIRPGEPAIAVIEDVRPLPGDGKVSSGSLMHSRGVVEAVFSIARLEVHAVQPVSWQRHYGVKKADKRRSLELAGALYPARADDLRRLKDADRAEAILLAHYGLKALT